MRTIAFLLLCFVVAATVLVFLTKVPGETVLHLLIGWQAFIWNSFSRLTINWNGITTAILCMALLTFCGHSFLKWLSTGMSAPNSATSVNTGRSGPQWSWKRTVQLLIAFVLLFTAGIAFIGLVHQAAWLATASEPLAQYRLWHYRNYDPSWNLKMDVAMGFRGFVESRKQCPPNGEAPDLEQAAHSWQTRILPYMNVQPPYPPINLAKNWDDPENTPIFRRFVIAYLNPEIGELREGRGYAVSHYAGNKRLFAMRRAMTRESLTSGTTNTIVCGEVVANFAGWGDPANLRDPVSGVNQAADGFGSTNERGAEFLMRDGSVRFLSTNTDRDVLAALATPREH